MIKSAVIIFKRKNNYRVCLKSYDISYKLHFLIKWYSQSKNQYDFLKINFKRFKYVGEVNNHYKKQYYPIYYVISAAS